MAYVFQAGEEFLVNTVTTDHQARPDAVMLSNGGFVVTWWDFSGTMGDSSGTSVKAQVFDPSGAKVGSEFLVNTATAENQLVPTVAALAGGGFVITWQDYSRTLGDAEEDSIKGQVFDVSGAKVGTEFLVNSIAALDQHQPIVTSLAGGGFVVTWHTVNHTNFTYTVSARVFSASGAAIGGDLAVGTSAGGANPSVTGLADGKFVVTWQERGDANGNEIKAQIYEASGVKYGGQFLVNSYLANEQFAPDIAALPGGGFVVTWTDTSLSMGDTSGAIKAQIYDGAGARVGGEFLVNTVTDNYQHTPRAEGLSDGSFVITWTDQSGTLGDNSSVSVKAQVFDAWGGKIGSEFLVNTSTEGGQYGGRAAAMADGSFIITWSDDSGTLGDSSGASVKAKLYRAFSTSPTEGNDSLAGTAGNDSIDGLGGNDIITGNGGTDTLLGGSGNDSIEGSGGLLDGGAGDDHITATYSGSGTVLGGDGHDTIVDEGGADSIDGGAGNDTIDSYSALIHGGDGNDQIYVMSFGDAPSVYGGEGNDVITVNGGSSPWDMILDGGAGNDTINAGDFSGGKVTTGAGSDEVIIAPGQTIEVTDFTAGAGGDRLDMGNMPGFLQPDFNYRTAIRQEGSDVHVLWDVNIGNWQTAVILRNVNIGDLVAANFEGYLPLVLAGATEGNDTLEGWSVSDWLYGLGGDDVLRGNPGADSLDGGTGNDKMYGGAGNDTYYVDQSGDQVIEQANEGYDRVFTTISWKAANNVEEIALSGTGHISAYGNALANMLYGNSGNNTLSGSDGNDTLNGGDGNDKLDGGNDHDVLSGEAGNDRLNGEAGSDSLSGGSGNDVLNGGARWDTLRGGEGNDILDGGIDNDQMYGGVGDDTYVVDHVGDRVYENFGEGADTVKASIDYSLTADVEVLNLTGTGNISGTGNGLHNAINGNSGNNALSGGLGNDSLYGWDGNDLLNGGNDHDRLSGGNGDDTLIGGHGNDVLGGGAGADDFVFSSLAVNGHDHIVDFVHGVDRLVFSAADYSATAAFTVGTAAVGAGPEFVWDAATRHLWFDADGAGAGDAVEVAMISGGAIVTKDDLYFT